MRQAIGGTWLIQLMILFILLFAGYIILTMNYSKTIKVKNEVVSIIEKYEGINSRSIELINSYLMASGYLTMGTCQSGAGIYGNSDYTTAVLEEAQAGKKYYYCIKKYKGANITNYYQVTVFYRFNLPVLGDISSFMVKGTTLNFQATDDARYSRVIGG
ncbi:MAG: hypothetical protein K2J20_06060 [Bacilli bacterium]|nr:hypothetical protein [Bacilli bacterium]